VSTVVSCTNVRRKGLSLGITDITAIVGAITGVGGFTVSGYTLIRTNQKTRRQEVRQLSFEVDQRLTAWIADIREAVSKKDSERFEQVESKLEDFMAFGRPDRGHEHERGLDLMRAKLGDYREFNQVVIELDNFQQIALDTKHGLLRELGRIIARPNLSDEMYKRLTDEKLKRVMDAYNAVIRKLSSI
jgi:hypothetical protein